MHTKEGLIRISESFFQALRDKDFEAIPFSNDIVFRAPVVPGGSGNPLKGKKEVFEKWWKALEPALDGVEIKTAGHYFNEALTEIMTKVEFTIPLLGATLRGVDQFVINSEGKIAMQENHFDASPMKSYIHHVGLRSINFNVTRDFYGNKLGWKLVMDQPELLIFVTGGVFIAFKKADPRNKENSTFSPFEVGLDHIAITCEREEDLHAFAKKLVNAGIENTGVKLDPVLNKLYVAFKDPDRIPWEFYMK